MKLSQALFIVLGCVFLFNSCASEPPEPEPFECSFEEKVQTEITTETNRGNYFTVDIKGSIEPKIKKLIDGEASVRIKDSIFQNLKKITSQEPLKFSDKYLMDYNKHVTRLCDLGKLVYYEENESIKNQRQNKLNNAINDFTDFLEKSINDQKEEFKDSDGDGVIDSEDNCPDKKGPISRNGCPPPPPPPPKFFIAGNLKWLNKNVDIDTDIGTNKDGCKPPLGGKYEKYGMLYNYKNAILACQAVEIDGGGWRLPKVEEFESLAVSYGGYLDLTKSRKVGQDLEKAGKFFLGSTFQGLKAGFFNGNYGGLGTNNEDGEADWWAEGPKINGVYNTAFALGYAYKDWVQDYSVPDKKNILIKVNRESEKLYFSCRCVKDMN